MNDDSQARSRREILKIGAAAGLGAAAAGLGLGAERRVTGEARSRFRAPALGSVRVGFVGVGGMGSAHVRNFLNIDGVEVKAICDIRPAHAERARKWVLEAGQPGPALYTDGPRDFERMCGTEDLDLVLTATPWEWHVPVCLAAMRNGKHAATEVPAAMTIDDCWALVEAAEKFGKHCQMMENCCYDRIELMTLNLVRQGVLGEVLHAEAGYLHDLRDVKFSNQGEGLWRRDWARKLNGNLYPTHGLGPVAQCLNINRGDAFDYLVSASSPARGLHEYAAATFGPDSPQARERFVLGDVNTSLIKTRLGKTIILIHDTNLPRPYTRINLVQGTKGLAHKWPDRIYIEGRADKPHQWDDFRKFAEEFEHPLWKAIASRGEGRGHGGMDYIEDYRLVQSLLRGEPLDQDVYDAAAWSAVVGASVKSVAGKGRPVEIPDFTRGKWKTNPPLGIVEA
ncbi:MAG TPA: Gfo/Idh/MocA family oxidoreductase [Candidatus Aminicenantes bacterium]|mgnify:CR=1 FL=1|nr:Gfo/Idh/MocA family oxidoreductase [Candidatus Aminicenantes bacterium]